MLLFSDNSNNILPPESVLSASMQVCVIRNQALLLLSEYHVQNFQSIRTDIITSTPPLSKMAIAWGKWLNYIFERAVKWK